MQRNQDRDKIHGPEKRSKCALTATMCIGCLLPEEVVSCSVSVGLERSHWIVPTHLQALRVQLGLSFQTRPWTIRLCSPELSLQSCPSALFQCSSPAMGAVPTAHSHSWVLGVGFCVLTSLKSHRKARNPHLSQRCGAGQLFVDKLEYDGWSCTCLICEGTPSSYSGLPALPNIVGVQSSNHFFSFVFKITLKNN